MCKCFQNLTIIRFIYIQDVYGVIVGGILGHSFCTGLAVLGGRMIAQKISVRTGIDENKDFNNKLLLLSVATLSNMITPLISSFTG